IVAGRLAGGDRSAEARRRDRRDRDGASSVLRRLVPGGTGDRARPSQRRPGHPRRCLLVLDRAKPHRPRNGGAIMSALTTLTKTQIQVFPGEPVGIFFGLVFPALLLFVIGVVFPGATDPTPDLGNQRLVDIYAPVAIALGLATVAVSILPATLGTDRERGILKRLSTTPVHPRTLVVAHLTVQLLVATIASVAAILVGALVFDIDLPQDPAWFVISFFL